MEEQKTTEQPTANNTDGNKPETTSIVDRADSIAKRLEEANQKASEILAKNEEILAKMMLSGRSFAGSVNKTPEQIRQEEEDIQVKNALKRFYPTR